MMTCPECGTRFEPVRKWHRFCSTACRLAYHTRIRDDMAGLIKKLNKEEIEEVKTYIQKILKGE